MGIEGGRTLRKDVGIGARRRVDPRRFKGLLDGLADGLADGLTVGFADGFVSRFGRFGSSDFMPSLLTGKLEQVATFLFRGLCSGTQRTRRVSRRTERAQSRFTLFLSVFSVPTQCSLCPA